MSKKVFWITGLSSAGKTTVGNRLAELLERENLNVIRLDGDRLREIFVDESNLDNSFSRQSRLEMSIKYSKLARFLSRQNNYVVVSVIGMFKEVYEWNRKNIPEYVEIFLKVPLDELRRRDPKGIYNQYFEGKISNVVGLDLIAEAPKNPDIIFEFNPDLSAEKIAKKVFSDYYLKS